MEFTDNELQEISRLVTNELKSQVDALYNNQGLDTTHDLPPIMRLTAIITKISQSLIGRERAFNLQPKIEVDLERFRNEELADYSGELGQAYHSLRNASIDTVGALMDYSQNDLLKVKNLGRTKLKYITQFFKRRNIQLKEE